MLGSNKGFNLVLPYGKVLVTILGHVDVITLEIDFGTELDSLDGSFYGYNDGKLEGLLLGDLLGYNDVKVF